MIVSVVTCRSDSAKSLPGTTIFLLLMICGMVAANFDVILQLVTSVILGGSAH